MRAAIFYNNEPRPPSLPPSPLPPPPPLGRNTRRAEITAALREQNGKKDRNARYPMLKGMTDSSKQTDD